MRSLETGRVITRGSEQEKIVVTASYNDIQRNLFKSDTHLDIAFMINVSLTSVIDIKKKLVKRKTLH